MKIVFLLPNYPIRPVGGFLVVYEYANHLVGRGHEVVVLHPIRLPNQKPVFIDFVQWARNKAEYLRDLIFNPTIYWHLMDKRVRMVYLRRLTLKDIPDADFIFATWWATAELILKYPLSKGRKFHLIQGYEVWGGPKERVDAVWLAPLHKVVISKWLYNKGVELGVPQEYMKYIPNGIDHEMFKITMPVDQRPKRVCMVYSSMSVKGSNIGIECLEMVKKEISALQAVLFGIESRPKWLPFWIEYYRDPSRSILVNEIYNKSSIFLSPSFNEGFSLPAAEAMSCGCAVVGSDSKGIREYTEDKRNALLSLPGDAEELANNLIKLLNDNELRIDLANEGYKNIQRFTWEESGDLLEKFLTQNHIVSC
jgi:glycosyltransferase involved in cell wall biosynthesis